MKKLDIKSTLYRLGDWNARSFRVIAVVGKISANTNEKKAVTVTTEEKTLAPTSE